MRWWLILGVILSFGAVAQDEGPVEEEATEEVGPTEEAEPTEEAADKPADKPEEDLPEKDADESESKPEEEKEVFNEWPALPEWDKEDLEKLKNGEIMPGEDLLREITGDLILPPPPEPEKPEDALPPEPEPAVIEEIDPTVIEKRFYEAYFGRRPASYLMDPQEMLARQEFRDRESFLEYHAGDSEVNLYVYLFDADHQLPQGYTLERVFDEHFDTAGPTALVFYFLGRPERSQMMLSKDIRTAVSEEERERALRVSIQEAFEKSDAAHQLDNFSVELSIRLYWFEKAMSSPAMSAAAERNPFAKANQLPPITLPPRESKVLQFLTKSLWAIIVLVISAVLGWVGRLVARRRLRYVFPEVEIEPLLGAPHAAGVGAVISFSSSQLPPSQQRDHVPDYLQRM